MCLLQAAAAHLPVLCFLPEGKCGHDFCLACLSTWCQEAAKLGKPPSCPLCRSALDSSNLGEQEDRAAATPVASTICSLASCMVFITD